MTTSDDPVSDRYRQLLDTAPDAIVVTRRDGLIELVNRQAETLFGYRREELLGQFLDLLVPVRFRGGHLRHVQRFFDNPTPRSMGSGIELHGLRKDGTEIPIEVSLSPVVTPEGLMVSAAIRDISERRRIEAAARLSAQRLSSAVESIQDAFALFDAEQRLVLCNGAYRQVLAGTLPGTLVGRSLREVQDAWARACAPEGEAAPSLRAWGAQVAGGEPGREVFDVRTRAGKSFRITNAPTPEGGTVQTVWDLSEDVRREEELREARRLAELGSEAKSEFLASMSHELRTPLNAVLGFAQLLQRDKKEPLSRRHLDRVEQILRGGEHLLRLIDDVLDLSRIEIGGVSISIEPVSLPDVIDEALSSLVAPASRAGVQIALEPLSASLPRAAVDRTRLLQVLMNLGSNAVKYNRPGGRIVFSCVKIGAMVRIAVADTGIGIAAEHHARLFQPFQRAGQETGPIEGTGIGLALSRRLAQLMGGDVGFETRVGVGSTFWIDVPAVGEGAGDAADEPPAEGVERRFVPQRTVLYVEDNPANVSFMKDLLSGFDELELVTAATAEIGIALARQRVPDVIVMDVNLPGMNGFDALRVLRELPATRDVPVVALTAAASERDRARGMQAGFFRYLTKPVKVAELEAALEEVLGHSVQSG